MSVRSSLFALCLTERHRSQNEGSLKSKERLSDFKERYAQLCLLHEQIHANVEADNWTSGDAVLVRIDADPVHTNAIPVRNAADPVLTNAFPFCNDADPVLTDAFPVCNDADPVLTNAFPVRNDVFPVRIDTDPDQTRWGSDPLKDQDQDLLTINVTLIL